MQQQFDEGENREPVAEDEENSVQVDTQQLVRKLLHIPQMWALLAILGGTLLGALIQSGLLGPLLMIAVIGAVVFLTRRQLVVDAPAPLTDAPAPQEQTQKESFTQRTTLNDLRLLTPREFEKMVGKVLEWLNYTQVEVVGGSGDLCVDIKAIGPNGKHIAV